MTVRCATVLLLGGIAACSSPDPGGEPSPDAVPPRCTSGVIRNPNESESAEMMPGRACNECHARTNASLGDGESPLFVLAGTVYPSAHEPDDCVASGAQGAEVVVTDSTGQTVTARVGPTGNFQVEQGKLTPPLQAKVVFQGRERRMITPQIMTDCNGCHTAAGAMAAPGRIVLP